MYSRRAIRAFFGWCYFCYCPRSATRSRASKCSTLQTLVIFMESISILWPGITVYSPNVAPKGHFGRSVVYNKVTQTLLHFAVSLFCVNKLNCRPSHCSQFRFCYRFAVARSPDCQDEIALACAIDWNAHRWKSLSLSELRYWLCCLYHQVSHIFVSSHY